MPRLLAFPPLLYLTALAVGSAVHWLVPVQVLPPMVARAAGGLLAGASLALLVWAQVTLHRAGTTALPSQPAVVLTFDGPYRWTRNPMCLSMAGMYLGVGLLLNALAPLVLFIPVFALMDRRVIPWEEDRLAARFGTPYLAYQAQVRRWL